jgi:hypothetical protein
MIYANNWFNKKSKKSLDKVSTNLDFDSKDTSKTVTSLNAKTVTSLNELLSQLKQIEFNIDNNIFKDQKSKIEFNQAIKKKVSKTLKSIISQENIYDPTGPIIYDPTGPIPFPKNVDLDDKYSSETFDNLIYLKIYFAAESIYNITGKAKASIHVSNDQLPPLLRDFPNIPSLTNKQLASLFGIPHKDLISVSIEEFVQPDSFSEQGIFNPEKTYKVTFERKVPVNEEPF